MTQKEKQLLIKDLCARLPYGPMCRIKTRFVFEDGTLRRGTCDKILNLETVVRIADMEDSRELEDFKIYLRPLLSMTEEEKEEWENTFDSVYDYVPEADEYDDSWHDEPSVESYDWLNAHHFDYRGLLGKGLALEAPEGMYNEKKEKDKPKQIPDTIEAAIAMLDTMVSDEDKEYILENGSISVHHSLGRWIRNEWGLWGESDLKKAMLDKGIEHPDDMSDYIVQRFIDHIKK